MKILIEMRGGLIDFIYSDEKDLDVVLLDWDEVKEAEAGEEQSSPVGEFPVNSLEDILPSTLKVIRKYRCREEP
jgi:hypothetical protein